MAKATTTRRKRIRDRLLKHYRLVIVNDDTLKTEASLKLNIINLILLISSLLVVFAAIIFSLILLTPLKETIPGFRDTYHTRQKLTEYKRLTDSLLYRMGLEQQYYHNLLAVLRDSPPVTPAIYQHAQPGIEKDIDQPDHDSMLRTEMEQKRGFSILSGQQPRTIKLMEETNFFSPLRGPVIGEFKPRAGHFGVDIVAAENTPIKAILAGRVIQAGWSSTDGHFIVIQHANNLTSIYKHNSALLKATDDRVNAGDVIAIIGDSGEYAHGLHLHFEMWYNMAPIDPALYISFK
jgi:murein DD-endopeptidase MepM/ murein hydrolase activator NlpD